MKDYPKFQRRPREIEDAIVANMSPTRRLANFLSKDDISCLISIFKKAKKSNHIDSVTQMVDDLLDDDDIFASTNIDYKPDYSKKLTVNYTAALNWNNGVSDILENKLREFYPDFEVVGGKFYLNQGSFKLHTDSGSDKNSIIYKIFTMQEYYVFNLVTIVINSLLVLFNLLKSQDECILALSITKISLRFHLLCDSIEKP